LIGAGLLINIHQFTARSHDRYARPAADFHLRITE
jgi:hypothetical protein